MAWVEAKRAVKNYDQVIGYSVVRIGQPERREYVKTFSVARKGGADAALHLANTMCDELNAVGDRTHGPSTETVA